LVGVGSISCDHSISFSRIFGILVIRHDILDHVGLGNIVKFVSEAFVERAFTLSLRDNILGF
jgi:hypothetical protein